MVGGHSPRATNGASWCLCSVWQRANTYAVPPMLCALHVTHKRLASPPSRGAGLAPIAAPEKSPTVSEIAISISPAIVKMQYSLFCYPRPLRSDPRAHGNAASILSGKFAELISPARMRITILKRKRYCARPAASSSLCSWRYCLRQILQRDCSPSFARLCLPNALTGFTSPHLVHCFSVIASPAPYGFNTRCC